MNTTSPSDNPSDRLQPGTGSTGTTVADDSISKREGVKPPWLSGAAILLGLIVLAVVGFGMSAGWFDSRGEPNARRANLPHEDDAPGGTSTQPQVSPQNSSAGSRTNSTAFSPPPLDALAPQDGVAIIEECGRVANHLIGLMPSSLDALEMQARYEFEFGKIELARSLWTRIIESAPRSVYALRGLGDIATLDGNFKEAVKFYRRAVLVEPANLSHQVKLGVALLAAEEPNESKSVLEAVTTSDEKYVEAHVELATALSHLEDFDAAASK